MLQKAIKDLVDGAKLYPVWMFQAYHELSSRYKRTILGSLWIASGMVSISLCISLIMGGLMGRNMHDILPYIMGGILCFSFCSYPLASGPEVFFGNGATIRNHAHPYSYYVFEAVARNFMQFAHNLAVYFIFVAAFGAFQITHWSLIPATLVVLVTMFTWGAVFGLMSARFRDLRFMLPFIQTLLFYLTPIMWHPDEMHGKRSLLALMNPFYGLVEVMRAPLMGFNAPAVAWGLAIGSMVSGIIMWLIFFTLHRRRIPFWV